MTETFTRKMFSIRRDSEYFSTKELQAQTGQLSQNFAHVVVKELLDNALDAAEMAKVTPDIQLGIVINKEKGLAMITVADNGPGMKPEVIDRQLNFETRTSDKAAYRSPTRGLQGNAFKTVIGIPYALGLRDQPIIIEALGVRHTIFAGLDPVGRVQVRRDTEPCPVTEGTRIIVTLPLKKQWFHPQLWAYEFSLFNPHARILVQISTWESGGDHW